jgi:hypothetical protein
MSLLNDPYALGRVVGFAVASGAAFYFLAKKLLPQRRTGAVARLMKNAGVEDAGEEKRSRWIPPPSLIAAVATPVATLVYIGLTVKPFSAADVSELRRGFTDGCMKRCVADGGNQAICSEYCSCSLAEVARRNQTADALADWFSSVRRDPEKMKELGEIQEQCAARVLPDAGP